MSMTLILWKAPVVAEPDEAKLLLEDWYENEDDSKFEPSADIGKVADELRRRWPYRELTNEETVARMSPEERQQYSPEALGEIRGIDEPDGSPWSDLPFWQSDRLLVLDIRWGAGDEVVTAICALARTCELVLYDPQGPDVFLPTDPLPSDDPIQAPGFRDWLGLTAIAAFLCALTYAAWLIPIWWLRWPAVAVAGFIAAAGLFALGAAIAGTLGWIDANEGRTPCTDDKLAI